MGDVIRLECDLEEATSKIGLKMNTSKTKIMANNTLVLINFKNNQIEGVQEYIIYLGQLLTFEKNI